MDIHPLHTAVYSLLADLLAPLEWEGLTQAVNAYQHRSHRYGQITDILPILSCMALQGEGESAIPLAASWIFIHDCGAGCG